MFGARIQVPDLNFGKGSLEFYTRNIQSNQRGTTADQKIFEIYENSVLKESFAKAGL